MSRDVSASGRGFMATPMLIFCVFHSGIPCPSKWRKKIIFKPRESSPRVDGVWTCQIIAIETFRCKLKRGSQIILGGMGTIPYIWQCYPLASLFDSASWHFVQVGHRLPKDGEQKKNYNSIYLVIMVKKSFANRWLLVCLYNGPSLRPTMVSMANDIEMIKMREEWGSSLDLLFSPTRSRYARPRDGNKRLAEKSHKIFRVLFEFYRASISRD